MDFYKLISEECYLELAFLFFILLLFVLNLIDSKNYGSKKIQDSSTIMIFCSSVAGILVLIKLVVRIIKSSHITGTLINLSVLVFLVFVLGFYLYHTNDE